MTKFKLGDIVIPKKSFENFECYLDAPGWCDLMKNQLNKKCIIVQILYITGIPNKIISKTWYAITLIEENLNCDPDNTYMYIWPEEFLKKEFVIKEKVKNFKSKIDNIIKK